MILYLYTYYMLSISPLLPQHCIAYTSANIFTTFLIHSFIFLFLYHFYWILLNCSFSASKFYFNVTRYKKHFSACHNVHGCVCVTNKNWKRIWTWFFCCWCSIWKRIIKKISVLGKYSCAMPNPDWMLKTSWLAWGCINAGSLMAAVACGWLAFLMPVR